MVGISLRGDVGALTLILVMLLFLHTSRVPNPTVHSGNDDGWVLGLTLGMPMGDSRSG